MNIQMIAFDQMIFCKVSTRHFSPKIISNRTLFTKVKFFQNSFMILWLISKRHIILICIYMFNVDTQKSHIWTSVSCFLSELGSIPLLLFIPSTNSGNYLSFSHSMDFSFSNFRRTMKFFPFCSPSTLRRFIILCKWVAIIFPSRQETHYKEVINFVRKCF